MAISPLKSGSNWNLENVGFSGEGKTGVPGQKPLEQRREPTTNSTHILTDWSTTGEQGKLVFVVSTKPSLAQYISLFTTGKNRLSIVQITHKFKFFTLRFLSRKKRRKEIRFDKQKFFS